MTYAPATINPFFAARLKRVAPAPRQQPEQTVYATLPRAPRNASPVPHLSGSSSSFTESWWDREVFQNPDQPSRAQFFLKLTQPLANGPLLVGS